MEFLVEDQGEVAAGATPTATVKTGAGAVWEMAVIAFKAGATSPPTVPAQPSGLNATAGNASAFVSWTAPSNGGSPITSYTVTPFMGSTQQPPTIVSGSPPATSASIAGLTNGTAYTFTVSATNAVGQGPASVASNPVTPAATAPNAPVIDPTTPPVAPFGSAATSASTGSFSPPAASVLYAALSIESEPGTSPSVAGVTNSGTALTWHRKGANNVTNSSVGGFTEIWWAYNASAQSNISVTATLAQATKNVGAPTGAMQVIVLDHAASDQTSAAWTPTEDLGSGSLPTGSVTTTVANSLVFAVVDNWDTGAQPGMPSGQTTTINGQNAVEVNPTDGDTYWAQVQTAATATPGSVTMTVTSPSVQYHMIVWEVTGGP